MSKKTAVFFVLVIAATLLLAREGARRGQDRAGTGRVQPASATQAPEQEAEEEAGEIIIFTIPPYPPPMEPTPQAYPYPEPYPTADDPCEGGIWIHPQLCKLPTPTPADPCAGIGVWVRPNVCELYTPTPEPTHDPNQGQVSGKVLAAQAYPPPGNETADFDITIWTASYIIVRWESQPAGLTSILCTVTPAGGTPTTLYLQQFTWPEPSEPWGEWRAYYSFAGRSWIASCRGYLNQVPVTSIVTAAGIFSNTRRAYIPMILRVAP